MRPQTNSDTFDATKALTQAATLGHAQVHAKNVEIHAKL